MHVLLILSSRLQLLYGKLNVLDACAVYYTSVLQKLTLRLEKCLLETHLHLFYGQNTSYKTIQIKKGQSTFYMFIISIYEPKLNKIYAGKLVIGVLDFLTGFPHIFNLTVPFESMVRASQ